MERVLEQHIRSGPLSRLPLHPNQFAYQPGKSTITALHNLVNKVEKAIEDKNIALCAFVDIEGAFDNTSYESIERAAINKGIELPTVNWIKAMLKSREITAKLGGESATVLATKGCPQGGVLSPLLWSLVVDGLLNRLAELNHDSQGYSDDLAIVITGKHELQLSNSLQNALNVVLDWCQCEGLNVNPNKTIVVPFTRRRKLSITAPILLGTTIELSGEVKYLGVTLDQKLTWNPHLNKVIQKATSALWTCHKFFGKTWGLKPKMIHWSYLAIVRPSITYAALVWWPKVEQKTAQQKLQKIQRQACLGITGAMRTCPTAALEALLNLPPLHLRVKAEALKCALGLRGTASLITSAPNGHVKILNEVLEREMACAPSDTMPRKFNFEFPFKVTIYDRQTWSSGEPHFKRGALTWFTDGSKMGDKTGVGLHGPNFKLAKALGSAPSIFQAEIHAIELCAHENIKKGLRGANIFILSDSQAALKALSSYRHESKLTWDCLNALKTLAAHNKVTLMWVPGHAGIEGNEKADLLAKEGANLPFFGPEPFCGLPRGHLSALVRSWENEQKILYWECIPGLRQAKRLISHSPQKTKKFLTLGKRELRAITGLLSGHGPLGYHLKKLRLTEDDTCRLCLEGTETSEHVLCVCPAIARSRWRHFGQDVFPPDGVRNADPSVMLRFIRSAGLDWVF